MSASCIPTRTSAYAFGPEAGAQCGNSARWDLRGGRRATGVPTANTTGAALSGTLTLLSTSGSELWTFPFTVPPGETVGTNTSALGVGRNQTGTAKFTHNGPPGAFVLETAIANFSISPAYVQPVKFQTVRDAR